jgi:hypothetical protein
LKFLQEFSPIFQWWPSGGHNGEYITVFFPYAKQKIRPSFHSIHTTIPLQSKKYFQGKKPQKSIKNAVFEPNLP